MRGPVTEIVAVVGLASIVILAIAAPVLRAPSERVFGMEIVGRHSDPFTMMARFERPVSVSVYSQPITDITGAFLARLSDPVAAYNWLVLLSFPLSAGAAFLLARHLTLSLPGATVAAMAYAFSPFHLAHAAYHPHIAQTQWLPLYLLALWRCLDNASAIGVAFLAVATVAVTLSNFYGGLIAAVITPVALAVYWFVTRREHAGATWRLGITVGSLLLICAAGTAYAWHTAGGVFVDRAAYAFSRADLFRYSAKWWSYLVPPVEHPLLGGVAHRLWAAVGVREGLLEQQVSLGWGILALAFIAVIGWLSRDRELPALSRVPVLVIVAFTAVLCALSPERTIGTLTFVRPSALLYYLAPMFRSYARFGVVVQLMAAVLAGIGVDRLRRVGTRRARILCVALVTLAAAEYSVAPGAMWRDVLPTTAHRWVAQQHGRMRVLDCTPRNQESESIPWLTGSRITLQGSSTSDCTEPAFPERLAAMGYTHLLVRRDSTDGHWFALHPEVQGLRMAATFDDGQVFAVTAGMPPIYTATLTGFLPREEDAEWTWRWMGKDATWTIVNTGAKPLVTTVGIELSAFHRARRMELLLDGRHVQTVVVEPARRIYQVGPLTVVPGGHELKFHPVEVPTVAGDVINTSDRRPLSLAFGTWNWTVRSEQP